MIYWSAQTKRMESNARSVEEKQDLQASANKDVGQTSENDIAHGAWMMPSMLYATDCRISSTPYI